MIARCSKADRLSLAKSQVYAFAFALYLSHVAAGSASEANYLGPVEILRVVDSRAEIETLCCRLCLCRKSQRGPFQSSELAIAALGPVVSSMANLLLLSIAELVHHRFIGAQSFGGDCLG